MTALHTDFARAPVPETARRGSLWVAVTSAAWIIAVTTLFTGGSLGVSLGLTQALIAIVIGLSLIAIIGGLLGQLGAKHGVSTAMLAHYTFGKYGASLLGVVIALTLGVGWFAWQVSFFAVTLREAFPDEVWSEPRWSMIWSGTLMTATAFGGFKWLSRLSMVAVPLVLALSAYGMFIALEQAPIQSETMPDGSMNLFGGITAVVGSVIFGAIVLPDISRYARSRLGGIAVSSGYVGAGLIVMVAGAVMATAVAVPAIGQTANIPAVMGALGMGFAAFFVLLFAQWTTNDSNLYSGALGLSAATRVPKGILVIAMGIAGVTIASLGIQDQFVPFLNVLGTFMPPVAGVMIADYYVTSRSRSEAFDASSPVPTLNYLAIFSAIAGGLIASVLANLGGVFAAAAIIGFLSAMILHILLTKIAQTMRFATAAGTSLL
ncbi:MAG: cytosine permease [Hyphomonas sp.]|uniref:purine-cytosine permease family protein n=1 Tax=Hyphomonas sp. TaxID=87 RepID=UPI001D794BE0|nr:cytosine permease [Hyphomonas sp.]MBA4226223.1 cytosine permease [Hyphomonas sp.]